MHEKMNIKQKFYTSLSLLLVILMMLVGCTSKPSAKNELKDNGNNTFIKGKLTIYAENNFRSAIDLFLYSFNLSYPKLQIEWATKDKADIIITDRIPEEQMSEFAVLNSTIEDYQNIFLDSLIVKKGEDIIAVPLFLELDAIWYKETFFAEKNVSAPLLLNDLATSKLNEQYPAISYSGNAETLFWSILAPIYLSNGGQPYELQSGSLNKAILETTLMHFETLKQNKILNTADSPESLFTKNLTQFWAANISDVCGVKNHITNFDSVTFMPSVISNNQDADNIVIRSSSLAVKKNCDINLVEIFLSELFSDRYLTGLSVNLKMPLACKTSYNSHSIPEFVVKNNSVIALPSVKIHYLNCLWDDDTKSKLITPLQNFINDSISLEVACETMIQ